MAIADSKSAKCFFSRQNKIQESPSFLLKHYQYIKALSTNPICFSPTHTSTQEPLPLQDPFSLHLTVTLLSLWHLLPDVRLCFLGNRAQKSLSALTMIHSDKEAKRIQHPHHLWSRAGPEFGGAACANSHTETSAAFSYQLYQRVQDAADSRVCFFPLLCLSDQRREREAYYRPGCTAWRVFSKLPHLS